MAFVENLERHLIDELLLFRVELRQVHALDDFVEDSSVLGGREVFDLVAGQVGLSVEGRNEDRIVHVGILGLRPVLLRQRLAEERLLEADETVLVDPRLVEAVAHERQIEAEVDAVRARHVLAQLLVGALGSVRIEHAAAVAGHVAPLGLQHPRVVVHLVRAEPVGVQVAGAVRLLPLCLTLDTRPEHQQAAYHYG